MWPSSFLRIWSYLLNKTLMEKLIFYAVIVNHKTFQLLINILKCLGIKL